MTSTMLSIGKCFTSIGRFIDRNFDKLLLTSIFAFICIMVLHMMHDKGGIDNDHILWAREMAGTVLGGLLGLITGHMMATRATASTPGGGTAMTMTSGDGSSNGDVSEQKENTLNSR
jgi:hypothetical protein